MNCSPYAVPLHIFIRKRVVYLLVLTYKRSHLKDNGTELLCKTKLHLCQLLKSENFIIIKTYQILELLVFYKDQATIAYHESLHM